MRSMWLRSRALTEIAAFQKPVPEHLISAVTRASTGHLLEISDLYDVERTPQRYLVTAGHRAALLEAAASVGACLGEAAFPFHHRRYGIEFGIATEIARDLDPFLATGETREVAGNAILGGIYTLPVIYALEADGQLRERLASQFRSEFEGEEMVAAVLATGGVSRAREDCHRHASAARQAAEETASARELIPLVDAAVARAEPSR